MRGRESKDARREGHESEVGAARGPFHRPFFVDRLHADQTISIEISADESERAALAELDGLVSIGRLGGRFEIERESFNGVRVTGEVEAEFVQTCVVTLDPFPAAIREPVDVRFAPAEDVQRAEAELDQLGEELVEGADLPDPPDPIIGGTIDLGAVAAEFLTLSLDPYPRKPGAAFAESSVQAEVAGPESPFAVLGRLKDGNQP